MYQKRRVPYGIYEGVGNFRPPHVLFRGAVLRTLMRGMAIATEIIEQFRLTSMVFAEMATKRSFVEYIYERVEIALCDTPDLSFDFPTLSRLAFIKRPIWTSQTVPGPQVVGRHSQVSARRVRAFS